MLMPAGRPYHRVTRTDSAVPGRGRVRQSAVLLLLSEADSLVTPFIRRAADRGPHSNQIALPGGAKERHDRSIIHTALREAEEEIGLSPGIVAVTGTLTPLYIDVSNYLITPVVGVYDGTSPFPWSSLRPNPLEVAEIIPVPLCELDETRTERVVSSRRGTITVPSYHFGGKTIWGATAMIVAEMLSVCSIHKIVDYCR